MAYSLTIAVSNSGIGRRLAIAMENIGASGTASVHVTFGTRAAKRSSIFSILAIPHSQARRSIHGKTKS
jgi:hypothetical protein